MRKTVAAATMAGALTFGAGAGAILFAPDLVNAQTDDTSDTADEDGAATGPERGQWLADALAPLVEDGTIDQGQADAVIAAIQDAKPERLPGRMHGPGHRFPILEDVTDVLGLSAEELRTALADGQTLAEIAEANGVDTQAVVDALLETFNERIDAGVEDGRITEEEADEKRAEAAERAEAIVNGDVDFGRGPGGHRFGGHGHVEGDTDTDTDDAVGS